MNILHVLDHHWHYNGMVHAAVDLACAQAAMSHKVAVYSAGPGSFGELLRAQGVEVIEQTGTTGPLAFPTIVTGLWSTVGRLRPDVLHAHMTKTALVAYGVSRARGVPLVTCVQNSFSKYAALMKVGDRVITGCKAVANDMEARGIPRQKLRPILNGTIGAVRQVAMTDQAPVVTFKRPAVVTFAGMHWRKGIPDLIEAFQAARLEMPELNLYLFGEGPNLAEYRLLVNAENKGAITFCDPVPSAKPYLRAADVFVLASHADPAPLAICEARDAGCAVIATRVDGIPELLEDGAAGILVEPRAPEQIAEKLRYLFSNPEHLDLWRQRSQTSIARLTVQRVAEESVQVYEELVDPGNAVVAAA